MVEVLSAKGNFCIDAYEVSAGDKCAIADPQSEIQSRDNLDTNSCIPISAPGTAPWRFISQNQASLACARAGKRLPTNEEWQQAALGTPDSTFEFMVDDCQVANNWPAQPGPTGSGGNCKSASGAYDMVGNLWEWTDGTVTEGIFNGRALPLQGYIAAVGQDGLPSETSEKAQESYYNDYLYLKKNGTRAIARGGYWNNKEQAGVYSAYIVSLPSYAEAGIGFRCVK
jgi:formylglycine-generating enzyme required for sulfatase activity